MKNIDLQKYFNKKTLPYIIGAIVLIIIVYYFLTKNKNVIRPPKDTGIVGDLSDEKIQEITALARNLFDDMNGWNVSIFGLGYPHDFNLYNKTSMLSNTELVALSNIFNLTYESKLNQTFYQVLKDEDFSWESFEMQGKVNAILDRLESLGVQ